MRSFVFAATLIFAACSGAESNGQPAGAAPSVETRPANTEFTPAFAGQTRAPASSSGVTLASEEIARGLHRPWAIVFLPDGRALVTERSGNLRIITRDGSISQPIAGVPPVDARGQGGLFDVVLGPTFAADRVIYWSYAEPREGGNGTSVARGRLSDDDRRVENVQVIFRQMPTWASRGHFGSRLVFDREGHLFVTLGDRQGEDSRGLAQDTSNTIGKIVRINADGSIPADNPFAGRAGADAAIWSYGHRNVQGADLHPVTGALWAVEHGPQGGDELNIPQASRNYGWPVICYCEDYGGGRMVDSAVREGMEQPVYYWDPIIAPGDMDFYRGDLFPWRGDVLVAGLRSQSITRLDVEGERVVGEERFTPDLGRIRDLAEAADGAIWIVTDEDNGRVLRLTPQR